MRFRLQLATDRPTGGQRQTTDKNRFQTSQPPWSSSVKDYVNIILNYDNVIWFADDGLVGWN
jgi:hypothetical protein